MLSIRGHVLRMAALAWPIIVAELGWMAMGLVDTVMVAPLGKEAIGAVGVANILYDTFGIFALGLLLGLDPLVAQAFGAGRPEEANRHLRQGVWLALFLTPPTMLMALSLPGLMTSIGVQPPVRALAGPYIDALAAGTLPLLLYAAFRRFLQATGRVRPVMVALVLANGVNAAANAVLIHGAAGIPAFGVAGSGWATAIARLFLAGWLLAAAARRPRRRADWPRNRRLRRRHHARRTALHHLPGGAPHRSQPRQSHLHGAPWHLLGRRRGRWAGPRPG